MINITLFGCSFLLVSIPQKHQFYQNTSNIAFIEHKHSFKKMCMGFVVIPTFSGRYNIVVLYFILIKH